MAISFVCRPAFIFSPTSTPVTPGRWAYFAIAASNAAWIFGVIAGSPANRSLVASETGRARTAFFRTAAFFRSGVFFLLLGAIVRLSKGLPEDQVDPAPGVGPRPSHVVLGRPVRHGGDEVQLPEAEARAAFDLPDRALDLRVVEGHRAVLELPLQQRVVHDGAAAAGPED